MIAALFVLPFAAAGALYLSGWRPAAKVHGELISDPAKLPFGALLGVDGLPLSVSSPAGHWTLLLAHAGPCADDCQTQLASLRRIHVALGKQMPRVKRVWLSRAPAADAQLAALRAAYPDLIVAAPGNAAWQTLLPATGARLFIIDPTGQPVVSYPASVDPRGPLRDIERLLKYSWIG